MTPSELTEKLRAEAMRLSGHSLDRGCADSGIAANLADSAADLIDQLVSERATARRDALEEAAALLDDSALHFNQIRDPGMANHDRAHARRIRALGKEEGE